MAEKSIVMERSGGEAKLILNRPEIHNPLDGELIDLLAAQLESLAEDPSVRVLTLRGAGPSFQCRGGSEILSVHRRGPPGHDRLSAAHQAHL